MRPASPPPSLLLRAVVVQFAMRTLTNRQNTNLHHLLCNLLHLRHTSRDGRLEHVGSWSKDGRTVQVSPEKFHKLWRRIVECLSRVPMVTDHTADLRTETDAKLHLLCRFLQRLGLDPATDMRSLDREGAAVCCTSPTRVATQPRNPKTVSQHVSPELGATLVHDTSCWRTVAVLKFASVFMENAQGTFRCQLVVGLDGDKLSVLRSHPRLFRRCSSPQHPTTHQLQ